MSGVRLAEIDVKVDPFQKKHTDPELLKKMQDKLRQELAKEFVKQDQNKIKDLTAAISRTQARIAAQPAAKENVVPDQNRVVVPAARI